MTDTAEDPSISPDAAEMSVPDIIKAAGGAVAIAAASEETVTAEAVYKWPKNGIPYPHWPLLMRLAPAVTERDLLNASMAVRDATSEKAAS